MFSAVLPPAVELFIKTYVSVVKLWCPPRDNKTTLVRTIYGGAIVNLSI
jgi:hypothetical protein